MAIRDGADVTIAGSNVILGPNFIAEEGSTFLATHDVSAVSAPESPRPDLELTDDNITAEQNTEDAADKVLIEAFPNPFNPSVTFSYDLAQDSQVSLAIYNVLGQQVKSLFTGERSAGKWEVVWDGLDQSGRSVPSGAYFYRLETLNQVMSGKVVLLK